MFLISRSTILSLLVLIGLVVQNLVMLPKMPGRIATSFGTGGVPHGWMTHPQFIGFELFMVLVLWAAFFWMPGFFSRFPNSINLPNRDYWLAPERRQATLADLKSRMQSFGVIVLVFFGLMMQATFNANLAVPVRLDERSFFWGLGLWMILVIAWSIKLTRRYRRR